MKFAIKTLGCKVNQYEEQLLRENLLRYGFLESAPGEADIFILNSCTVTDHADRKAVKLLRRAKKNNPGIKTIVTGCMAVFKDDIQKLEEMPEVYAVVPGRDKIRSLLSLKDIIRASERAEETKKSVSSFSAHSRAFLKIQDGCDQRCSYCKVTLVRGPSRCKDEEDVLNELSALLEDGFKEIVLSGICLGAWKGRAGRRLADLVKRIDEIKGLFRVRLSSIEPNHIDPSLIKALADSQKICPHFHLPLQSGSDRILKGMNREYTARQFREIAGNIRRSMPLAGLTIDVMTGFPGETESDFLRTLDLIKKVKPSRLHVFSYSDRKGTVSSRMFEKVPPAAIKERTRRLMKEGLALEEKFCEKFVAREVEVLVEKRSRGFSFEGYTREYVKARLDGLNARPKDLIKVRCGVMDRERRCLMPVVIPK